MIKKRIAFDIDGVLADTERALKREIVKRLPSLKLDDMTHSGMYYNMYQFDNKVLEREVRDVVDYLFKGDPEGVVYRDADPMGSLIVMELMATDYELAAYITRRPVAFNSVTRAWLDSHGYPALQLYHVESGTCKSDKMRELGIEVIIEDSPYEIESCLQNGVEVIIMPHVYNADLRKSLSTRTDIDPSKSSVSTWTDLFDKHSVVSYGG